MKPIFRTNSGMNKTEHAYQQELELKKRAGIIIDYRFEAMKFRLADNTFYTPDFMVVYPDRFELHEVKGFWRDDARVKIKVVNEMYPWYRFKAVKRNKGHWEYEDFS